MNKQLLLVAACAFALSLTSCKEDPPPVADAFGDGVYVVNEGNYGSGNSGVTHYDRNGRAMEVPFSSLNGRPVGDVLQSITIFNRKAYLIVNVSGKVEVADLNSFRSDLMLSNSGSPRYLLPVSANKLYLTDWGNNSVNVYLEGSPAPYTSIATGTGPEQLIIAGGKVFVANLGGFGVDSTLTVINPNTDAVEGTVTVARGPVQLQVDADGKLWVLCRGDYGDFADPLDDIGGQLLRIDPATLAVEASFSFQNYEHPMRLAKSPDGTKLYYLTDGVYEIDINATALPATALVSRYFYGIGVDPQSGYLYCADPLDYQQRGRVIRYQPNGTVVDSFDAGIIPGDFAFN